MKFKRFGNHSALALVSIGVLFLLNNSCKHDEIPADKFQIISFKDQVVPIFQNSCGTKGCHDSGSSEAGYDFTNSEEIYNSLVPSVPKDPSKSKAYRAMTSTFQIMPPNGSLTTTQRTIIRLWIEQGAVK